MVNARVLKFPIHILHNKIVDPYFFVWPSYAPFWSYVPLKTKFEKSCVQGISKSIKARAFIFGTLVGAEK